MEQGRLESLLARARRSDPQALGAIVEAYSPRVYGLLYRLTRSRDVADDLVQETFLRMVRTIIRYEDTGRFEAWLFRIAANLARDHARRGRRRGPVASLDGQLEADVAEELLSVTAPEPLEPAVGGEETRRLERGLEKLAPQDREVLLLRHFSELPFREIAEILGVPLGTALARAHRALERLRTELCQDNEPGGTPAAKKRRRNDTEP